ncbi:MAG TPA: hypothetical protein VG711_08445 [Phycisphaerales bacterium]|nr:hypothetical protein [Phycisphaerales bacterium]
MTSPHTAAHPTPAPTHAEQGYTIDASNAEMLRHAVELAVNYRGDVTVTRKSDGQTIEGFVFDFKPSNDAGQYLVRILPKDGSARMSIPLADVARLVFSGKDTAAGKSFETWVKKYVQKKMAGETASIESESLDEA